MGKTLTKTDETRQELTGAQYNAIAAMLSGATITAAAEVAGVQRQTVHEWLRTELFALTLNKARAELWEAQQHTLRALGDKANSVLETALDSDDMGIALKAAQIVKRAIAADGPPRGPKTAEDWVLSNWSMFG